MDDVLLWHTIMWASTNWLLCQRYWKLANFFSFRFKIRYEIEATWEKPDYLSVCLHAICSIRWFFAMKKKENNNATSGKCVVWIVCISWAHLKHNMIKCAHRQHFSAACWSIVPFNVIPWKTTSKAITFAWNADNSGSFFPSVHSTTLNIFWLFVTVLFILHFSLRVCACIVCTFFPTFLILKHSSDNNSYACFCEQRFCVIVSMVLFDTGVYVCLHVYVNLWDLFLKLSFPLPLIHSLSLFLSDSHPCFDHDGILHTFAGMGGCVCVCAVMVALLCGKYFVQFRLSVLKLLGIIIVIVSKTLHFMQTKTLRST